MGHPFRSGCQDVHTQAPDVLFEQPRVECDCPGKGSRCDGAIDFNVCSDFLQGSSKWGCEVSQAPLRRRGSPYKPPPPPSEDLTPTKRQGRKFPARPSPSISRSRFAAELETLAFSDPDELDNGIGKGDMHLPCKKESGSGHLPRCLPPCHIWSGPKKSCCH